MRLWQAEEALKEQRRAVSLLGHASLLTKGWRSVPSVVGKSLCVLLAACLWRRTECCLPPQEEKLFQRRHSHGGIAKGMPSCMLSASIVLCTTSHWRLLYECTSRGRKGSSFRQTAPHWRLTCESASGKVFL